MADSDADSRRIGRAFVGISGWSYASWRGGFYPKGLKAAEELRYAASKLSKVELNASFYSLQRPVRWRAWRDATPEGFLFAVKGSRFITHVKKLRDAATPLANFFASGVLQLLIEAPTAKLGPILWQLPPTMPYNPERIGHFLDALPMTVGDAFALAGRHSLKLAADRVWLGGSESGERPDAAERLYYAIEPRHGSFTDPRFAEQLRTRNIALVRSDGAGHWPEFDRVTANFAYARLHGSPNLYASGYTPGQLDAWAAWARAHLHAGRDVFLYFDNDAKGHAPFDALAVAQRLRMSEAG